MLYNWLKNRNASPIGVGVNLNAGNGFGVSGNVGFSGNGNTLASDSTFYSDQVYQGPDYWVESPSTTYVQTLSDPVGRGEKYQWRKRK